jgi:hypothetical protein
MKTYKAYIPKWEIKIKAKSLAEAHAIAGETFDDHMYQNPYMGQIIIKETK